jgi:hypothetical protein
VVLEKPAGLPGSKKLSSSSFGSNRAGNSESAHNPKSPMKTYRHNLALFLIIPVLLIVISYVAYSTWTFEGEMQGGEAMRYGLTAFCVGFVVGCGYLFFRFGIVRYYVLPEGIMVKKLFSSTVRSWPELKELKINWRLKYFLVRDTRGKVVIFSSLDYFRDVNDFLAELQKGISGPPGP